MKQMILLFLITVFSLASSYNNKMLKQIEAKNLQQKNFSFVVMGDNRDGDRVLEQIIKDVNKDKNIQFAINNGDLVPDGYVKEFKYYLKKIKTSKKPIISIIGNHEIPWYDGEKNYDKTFGKTYFSFTFGNSYFIILDDSNERSLGKEQRQWLIHKLKISQNFQNRFVFMHVPLYDPRYGKYAKGHSIKKIKKAKRLNDIFDKYKVTMLFCSHIHAYFRGTWHKTPFIITGGAGAPLYKYKNNAFYHYIKVNVDGKNVTYRVVKIDMKQPGFIHRSIQSIKDVLNIN